MKKAAICLIALLISCSVYGCKGENTSSVSESDNSDASINVVIGTGNGTIDTSDEIANVTEDGFLYSITEDGVLITGYTGNESKIEIPEKINNQTVISIENSAFSNCDFIEEAVIPDNVLVGYNAFEGTALITNNTDEFVIIGKCLYQYNGIASSITIPENISMISPNAFYENTTLKEIIVKSNVSTINIASFSNCQALEKVILEEGITDIKSGAFSQCISLESIEIPSTLKSIGIAGFSGCNKLKEINLPENIEKIEDRSFENCTSLSKVNLPDSIQYIGAFTFLNCTSLSEVNIPQGVNAIYSSAFAGCTSLKSMVIPSNVESIFQGAFFGCTALETIEIPETVTNIVDNEDEDYANNPFDGCNNLTIITSSGSIAETYAIDHEINVQIK